MPSMFAAACTVAATLGGDRPCHTPLGVWSSFERAMVVCERDAANHQVLLNPWRPSGDRGEHRSPSDDGATVYWVIPHR